MNKLTATQIKAGDYVQLTHTPNWDGEAVVLLVSGHCLCLHMTTGVYAGGEGTFDWRDADEWSVVALPSN